MNNQIKLLIEKALYGGAGLAFYNGKAVFVPFGIPGERYELRIVKELKDYYEAEILNVLENSEKRINPVCPNFYVCGGCSYMHISYEQELKMKIEILKDNLLRIAKFSEDTLPGINIIQGERYYYRSHCEIKQENGLKGFYQKNSNKVIPFPENGCAIISQEINDLITKTVSIQKNIKFACSHTGKCVNSESHQGEVVEKSDNIIITRSLNSFYQANKYLRLDMLNRVKEYAQLNKTASFIDMHCGVGFFSLFLAQYSKGGVCFDINKEAVQQARKNAITNNIKNITFHNIPSWKVNFSRYSPDVILLDPPRIGLDKKTRRTVMAFGSPRIVYVSCNPATFARDVADFIKGGYECADLTLIDMFPCTHHIEIISKFIKK